MTDPTDALTQLQIALDNRAVQLIPCEIHRELGVIADTPNGKTRFTYALMKGKEVKAVSLFVLVEPIDGTPCFTIGYAVVENERSKGVGTKIVKQGIDELQNGFKRNGISEIYIEAIISKANEDSNRLAKKVFSTPPESITDCYSGEASFRYVRKLKLNSPTRRSCGTLRRVAACAPQLER